MTTIALVAMTLLAAPPANAFQPKARPYDAISYKLEVKVDPEGNFQNKLTAKLKPSRALNEIELDAYNLTVTSTQVDGKAATASPKYNATTKTGVLVIKPKSAVPAGKEATVEIEYTGKASTSHEGFFLVTDQDDAKAPPSFFTHFEPAYAQRFFPCNDQPSDKATFEITAVVDEKYTVLSNGRKEKDEKFTDGGKNLRRVTWIQDKPHSAYLTALAIGVFQGVEANSDIPATVWVKPGTADRAFVVIDALKPLWNFLVAFTGTKYPWAKLDVVALPRFYWSGMENTSLIFERDSKVVLEHKNDQVMHQHVVGLLAHEMAHQWFGNDVTCKWWDDTWLNEGFASYVGALAADDYNGTEAHEVGRAEDLMDSYFRTEDGPRSHALVGKGPASAEEVFDDISYNKGANVLHMLDLWIGRPEMKKVMKAYLEKYAYSSATSADFFKVVFDTTKKEKELKPFRDSWLTKRGYPVIYPDFSAGGNQVTIKIRQQPNRADEKGPFVFKLPIVLHRESEPAFTKEETILVDKPEVTVSFEVPATPEWINWNKDLGALVRINQASISEEQWVAAAKADPDPVWRLIATSTLLGELANPDMKEEVKPTDAAMVAIRAVLEKDASPYVRVAVMKRLMKTRFKKLPAELSKVIYSLSRKPTDLNEDPAGYILVRRTALELLGRSDSDEGHQYVLEELAKRELDINYVTGFAAGAARLGNQNAIGVLRAAITTQKGRGYPYYRRVVEALGSVSSPDIVPIIRDILNANKGNNELGRSIFERADRNKELKSTPEFGILVKDYVLDESSFGIELRTDILATLDDVKTDAAKETLVAIVGKTSEERVKSSAQQVLDGNFPAPKATPAGKNAPKKK